MLNKQELLELNRQCKFREIYSTFRNEFKEMIILFFRNNNIIPNSNDSLIELLTQLQQIDKKYNFVSSLIIDTFYNDEADLNNALNNCFDIHKELSSILN